MAALPPSPERLEAAYEPSNVPGALQCDAWDGAIGYSGPCPPNEHTYELVVYALDVAELSDVSSSSAVSEVRDACEAHSIGTAVLTGTYGG